MKKIVAVSTLSVLCAFANAASANEGVYVSGKLGTSVVHVSGAKSKLVEEGEVMASAKSSSQNKGVFAGGIAVGYDFNAQHQLPVRVELDATFRGNGSSNGHAVIEDFSDNARLKNRVKADTYMLNGYYDFHNSSAITPYISAGMGLAHVKLKHKAVDADGEGRVSGSSNNFAWGVGVGAQYAVTENIAIDAGYKYIHAGKVSASYYNPELDLAYKAKAKASVNDFVVGVTYSF